MSSSSRRTTSDSVLGRSVSPVGRFASSSTATFSNPSSFFHHHHHQHHHHHHHHRSSSPTRINVTATAAASGVRSAALRRPISYLVVSRRTCMCSPTNHPGSFRCALHKRLQAEPDRAHLACPPSSRLNMRRSAMTNSLVRIGTVEGDLVRRALAALIRPSSHQQRRRAGFTPRPSRLSVVSNAAGDL